jgi:predicted RND superfamily exporter protein
MSVPPAGPSARVAAFVYRFRWPGAVLVLGLCLGLAGAGWARIEHFSAQVAALGDEVPVKVEPQLFDPRSDIWFDEEDPALAAYADLEDRFVPEDFIFLAVEESKDPWGVFGVKTLERIARLTDALETIPYVRNVRSLTQNPWIRWGEAAPGEEGLLVSDLFENPPGSYSDDARLERMVAILGAKGAAALASEQAVRRVLGPDARFEDHIGEPRLLKGVVSPNGRVAAIQIQVLRPQPSEDKLDQVFGPGASIPRTVGPVIHKSSVHGEVVKAIDQVLETERKLASANGEALTFHISGVPVVEKHFMDVGQGDMAYVGLMFAVIALVLLAIYRRAIGVFLPLMVVFVTILGMNGFVWWNGDLLNNLTAMTPTVMTGVGIADAIHLVTAYYLLRPHHDDKKALLLDVLQRNAMPVFLTSLTTAVGFLSLTTSAIVPVRQLGYTAGVGTTLAYLISMTVVPAVLSLLPMRPGPKLDTQGPRDELEGAHWSDALVERVVRHRTGMAIFTLIAFVVVGIGLSRVQFATDMRLMFAEGDTVADDVTWLGENLGGVGDLELVFQSVPSDEPADQRAARQERLAALQVRRLGQNQAPLTTAEQAELDKLGAQEANDRRLRIATSAAFLTRVDQFQRRVQQEAQKPGAPMAVISRMDSALDVLRKMHQVQNENRAEFYRVPTEADVPESARAARVSYDDILEESMYVPAQDADSLVAQYYLQYENGAKPSENLASLLSSDRHSFRLTTRIDVAPSTTLLAAFDDVQGILRDEFPELVGTEQEVREGKALASMVMTGKQYMFTNMFRRFSDTMVQSLLIALGCITALMVLVFRSPVLGLLSLVPNVLPIMVPLAALGLLGIAIDGPSVVVASVALGVCVDDTIHFLAKFTKARSEGLSAEDALRRSFRQVGSALTWTSIVLVLGFLVLTLGAFRPNIATGYLGATMIGLAWVADFFLLPALLSFVGRPVNAVASAPSTQQA